MTRIGTPVIDRILDKCIENHVGCWEFAGATSQGYGAVNVAGRMVRAHRYTYEFFRAEIPEGLYVDHLCSNRLCCNPWHLEPVTPRVNSQRAHSSGHCHRGHALTPENTYHPPSGIGQGVCRICIRRRSAKNSLGYGLPGERTRCPSGHEYDEQNTHIYRRQDGSSERRCRACARERSRRSRARRAASHDE